MMVVVEFALESVQHVEDAREARRFERRTGIQRSVATAADQHDRAVMDVARVSFSPPRQNGD